MGWAGVMNLIYTVTAFDSLCENCIVLISVCFLTYSMLGGVGDMRKSRNKCKINGWWAADWTRIYFHVLDMHCTLADDICIAYATWAGGCG